MQPPSPPQLLLFLPNVLRGCRHIEWRTPKKKKKNRYQEDIVAYSGSEDVTLTSISRWENV